MAARIEPMIVSGTLAICSMTDLELLFGARTGEEHRARREEIGLRFVHVAIDQSVSTVPSKSKGCSPTALSIARRNIPDLVVAAAAERAGSRSCTTTPTSS